MIKDYLYTREGGWLEIPMEKEYGYKKVIESWYSVGGRKIPKFNFQKDESVVLKENFESIPSYCCKRCGRTIIHYSEIYEGREYYSGSRIKWLFGEKNNYCRICALKKAKEFTRSTCYERTVTYNNGSGGNTIYFLNNEGIPTGEKIEDIEF